MRSGLMFLFFLHVLVCAHAQRQDSILLPAAEVLGIPEETFLKGSVVQALDSSVRRNYLSQHLGETLPAEFPIYFRNYGNGMLSTISFRGTSPEHTAVLWNGININSFSLGQADFSNLLTGAANTVRVHAGGGSARFGSGALGGTILLNSTERSPAFSVVQEIGSFGKYFTTLQGSIDIGKVYLSTSGYWMQAENDFKILSNGNRQPHASYLLWGLQQQVKYQWDNAHHLNLNYWYHNADREIQPTSGKLFGGDEQQDENHRLSLEYKSASAYGVFSSTAGFVQDVIVYNGSPSTVNRAIGIINHQFTLPGLIVAEVGGQWNHIVAKIDGYENDGATEDRFDLKASFQRDVGDKLSLSLNIRQPYVTGFDAPFLPYLGGEYQLLTKGFHVVTIRANASRNFRAPTLNERHWEGAGNLNILPEISFAAEGGMRWQWKKFVFDNTYFFQDVDQWIQWIPVKKDTTTKYIPENIKHVRINGYEARMRWATTVGRFFFKPVVSYQYVSSITLEAPEKEHTIGKQLTYTPKHVIAAYLQVRHDTYSAMVSAQFNSKRYTEPSNSDIYALDPFTVVNLSMSKSWDVGRHQFDLLASVRNLFNVDYKFYSGRAVPGRNFSIQLTYQLNHKQNEN